MTTTWPPGPPASDVTPPATSPAAARATVPPAAADPRAVLAALWLGAAAVLWLWWHHAPALSTTADALTGVGRVAGLLAGYAVVALVALMARIPALERGVGADRLARWHATGGRWVVWLIVVHALLITWGYAVSARTGVVSQSVTLLTSYPDVLAATVAALLLVGVGVVSMRAARRRMRYETWYYLHLYTYLAVALAFSHQLATGADFISDRPARLAWTGMYVVVGALLVWHRVLTPIRQAVRHRLRVVAVRQEAPGVVSIHIGGRGLDELMAEPGQFFRWRFLARGRWWASHPYSLSAPPTARLLRITVKAAGDHSAALARVRPGTRVVAEGPYGAFTARARRRRKVLLIAGGVGIAPLRALFETLPAGPGDLTLVYRVSRREDAALRGELAAIAADRGARLCLVAGRRAELAADPLSAAALMANVPGLRDHHVYVCGPPGMTGHVEASLRAAGVPAQRITAEAFEL